MDQSIHKRFGVVPLVGLTLPLKHAAEAHRILDDRAAYGTVVLLP